MSEIAVKIYEQKRYVQRFKMAHPVYGKDGASQPIVFVNADTKEPVDKICLEREGRYQKIDIMIGSQIKTVDYPSFSQRSCGYQLLGGMRKQDTETLYYSITTIYVSQSAQMSAFRLSGLKLGTVVTDWSLTFKYLDE